MDELDVALAKPQLMEVYTSKPAPGHSFPLHIQPYVTGSGNQHDAQHKKKDKC